MSDAILWYNVPRWTDHGLGLPNPGKSESAGRSLNRGITYMVNQCGRNLQAVMERSDASLPSPPSLNTIVAIHKLCIRARDILSSRAIAPNELKLEPQHGTPAPEDFLFYPTRYFKVENSWMKEYAGIGLLALTEMMQHSERSDAMEISTRFAGEIGQYFKRIYVRMSVELLRIGRDVASKDDFTLTTEHFNAYNPAEWMTSTELNATVRSFDLFTTEDDRDVLSRGIPYSSLPAMGGWPTGGVATGASSAAPAAATSSFIPAPGP